MHSNCYTCDIIVRLLLALQDARNELIDQAVLKGEDWHSWGGAYRVDSIIAQVRTAPHWHNEERLRRD